jgi:hypothetical protein
MFSLDISIPDLNDKIKRCEEAMLEALNIKNKKERAVAIAETNNEHDRLSELLKKELIKNDCK